MIKSIEAKYVIIGHSDNRAEGDEDTTLKAKVNHALKNNLKIIFCIGENKYQKSKNQTFRILPKTNCKSLRKKNEYKKFNNCI